MRVPVTRVRLLPKPGSNSVEPLDNLDELSVRQNAGGQQSACVRLAGHDFLFEKRPIELDGSLPLIKQRVQGLAKAAGPHLHLTTSFLRFISRARVRAGSPRIWMKPFASFWS